MEPVGQISACMSMSCDMSSIDRRATSAAEWAMTEMTEVTMRPLGKLKYDIVLIGEFRKAFDVRQYRSKASLLILTPRHEKAATVATILQHGLVLDDEVFGGRHWKWVLLVAQGRDVGPAALSLENMGYVRARFPSLR